MHTCIYLWYEGQVQYEATSGNITNTLQQQCSLSVQRSEQVSNGNQCYYRCTLVQLCIWFRSALSSIFTLCVLKARQRVHILLQLQRRIFLYLVLKAHQSCPPVPQEKCKR